jgi:hypothetical protein
VPKGFDKLINDDADVDDTLNLIIDTVNKYSKGGFVKQVVKNLSHAGQTDEEFIHELFEYYCRNISYILDQPGTEKVYTPERTIDEKAGDCKKAATFLAAVLEAKGIEPVLKHVYYNNSGAYTHIYVITHNPALKDVAANFYSPGHYITLDPTNDCQYNKEVKYKSATLYFLNGKQMELRQMGRPSFEDMNTETVHRTNIPFSEAISTGCNDMGNAFDELNSNSNLYLSGDGIGKLNFGHLITDVVKHNPYTQAALALVKGGEHLQNAILKSLKIPAKSQALVHDIPLEQQRGSMLALITNNVGGLASHLAAALGTNPNALDNVWGIVGGDINALKAEVLAGSKKPAIDINDKKSEALVEQRTIKGPEYIAGDFFKKLLHGAAALLRAVAPVINAIIPGAGAAVTKIADTADNIANNLPTINKGGITFPPAPQLPVDPHGAKVPAPSGKGHVKGGNFISSPISTLFSTVFVSNAFCHLQYFNHHTAYLVTGAATVLCIPIFYLYKKLLNL